MRRTAPWTVQRRQHGVGMEAVMQEKTLATVQEIAALLRILKHHVQMELTTTAMELLIVMIRIVPVIQHVVHLPHHRRRPSAVETRARAMAMVIAVQTVVREAHAEATAEVVMKRFACIA